MAEPDDAPQAAPDVPPAVKNLPHPKADHPAEPIVGQVTGPADDSDGNIGKRDPGTDPAVRPETAHGASEAMGARHPIELAAENQQRNPLIYTNELTVAELGRQQRAGIDGADAAKEPLPPEATPEVVAEAAATAGVRPYIDTKANVGEPPPSPIEADERDPAVRYAAVTGEHNDVTPGILGQPNTYRGDQDDVPVTSANPDIGGSGGEPEIAPDLEDEPAEETDDEPVKRVPKRSRSKKAAD